MSEAVQNRKERRISSPEELHDYMHVTGPGLWIMLAVIIGGLAVLIFFASTMKLENLMNVSVQVTDDGPGGEPAQLVCSLTDSRKDQVKIGMKVRVDGHHARGRRRGSDGGGRAGPGRRGDERRRLRRDDRAGIHQSGLVPDRTLNDLSLCSGGC